MTTAPTDVLVNEYLGAVERALVGLPVARRAELLADLREHIAAQRELLDAESEADVRSILERLGDPEAVAAEARLDTPMPPPVQLSPGPRATAVGWVIAVMLVFVALCFTAAVMGFVLFQAGVSSNEGPRPGVTVEQPTTQPS
jgi:uncharacterized membrane protein